MEPANILRIESLGTGWRDKDSVMLHACFQLLKDCIENESLLSGHVDWDHDAKHREAKRELEILYEWWGRKIVDHDSNDVLSSQRFNEENAMLARLIAVRWALWT
jgi:hypothetical protein